MFNPCRCLFNLLENFKGYSKEKKGAGKDGPQDCMSKAGEIKRGKEPSTVYADVVV